MKNMKLSFVAAFAILAMAVSFTGCTDPCKDVVCVNGECVEGDCVCDAGYEGTDCGTALNAKFVGTYSNSPETCVPSGTVTAAYSVTVTASGTVPTMISITGLWEAPGSIATATVGTDGTSFTIERQNYFSPDFEISGTGSIDAAGTVVTVDYDIHRVSDNTIADACDATLTKQ